MDAQLIFRYFPDLDQTAKARFIQLGELYSGWNQKINVISRKDMEHLYLRHVLHSLALSKAIGNNPFQKNVSVLDRSEERRVGKESRSRWARYQ